jgi:NADH:ubiquinone oxidoreductase subunit 4 (subunit M)
MDILSWQTLSWQILIWIAAGLFLPLFPMAMVFNAVFQRLHNVWARTLLLLLWPLPGIWLLTTLSGDVPDWVMAWALFSAALYAFRGIVVREIGIWTGYVATSAWALIWIAHDIGVSPGVQTGAALAQTLIMQTMAFSLPLVLLVLLVAELERRYESAYAGIVSGVAQAQPRLSGLLAIITLAVIGSPVFPAFFSMLHNITATIADQPMLSAGIAAVWLMWSWSAIRLLEDLLVGPALELRHEGIGQQSIIQQDLSQSAVIMYGTFLAMLVVAGIYIAGILL